MDEVIIIITAPSILEIGKDIVSVVAKGVSRLLRYAFSKTLGMTIKIGIRLGDVLVRGSFSVQNPTELTQDFVAMSSKGVIDYFVSPEAYENSTAIRTTDGQRQTMPNNVTIDELTLYLAVIGLNDNNTFTLNTTTGDTTESIPPSPTETPTKAAGGEYYVPLYLLSFSSCKYAEFNALSDGCLTFCAVCVNKKLQVLHRLFWTSSLCCIRLISYACVADT